MLLFFLFCSHLDIRFHIIGSGSLSVENVIESDAGTYMCRAQNSEDSIDSSATVDILGKRKYFLLNYSEISPDIFE